MNTSFHSPIRIIKTQHYVGWPSRLKSHLYYDPHVIWLNLLWVRLYSGYSLDFEHFFDPRFFRWEFAETYNIRFEGGNPWKRDVCEQQQLCMMWESENYMHSRRINSLIDKICNFDVKPLLWEAAVTWLLYARSIQHCVLLRRRPFLCHFSVRLRKLCVLKINGQPSIKIMNVQCSHTHTRIRISRFVSYRGAE